MSQKATKFGSKVYVCSTNQETDLSQSGYEALTWVQVGSVGKIGDFGSNSNDLTYNTLDEPVSQHQKGVADAGSPQLEVVDLGTDAGQTILRTFGIGTNHQNMAIKIERNDKITGGGTNTIFYSRGVVSGPTYVGGGTDDFELARYNLMLNQLPVRVAAT